MFGYPAAFVNGNMFMGLFQDQMIVRLPEGDRETLNRAGGTAFEPMPGRPMREYAVLPRAILENRKALSSWVSKALAYGRSLPSKASKGAEKRGAAAGKPRATIAKRSDTVTDARILETHAKTTGDFRRAGGVSPPSSARSGPAGAGPLRCS